MTIDAQLQSARGDDHGDPVTFVSRQAADCAQRYSVYVGVIRTDSAFHVGRLTGRRKDNLDLFQRFVILILDGCQDGSGRGVSAGSAGKCERSFLAVIYLRQVWG